MTVSAPANSPRRIELLEKAYRYVLERGVADLSLRPLATAVDSSPRVLLFLFGSKAGLVQALLARAREDELELLARVRTTADSGNLVDVAAELWRWLAAAEHQPLLTLWVEGYARSLVDPDGPWADFAQATVRDWLALLADAQPARRRRGAAGEAERTLVLAVLRGALLDLLATGDVKRTTDAVDRQLRLLA
ncbi:MAG TPA: TetR/AcrR family transcriptional regulator [Solirubrobacteraceae bacterium]|jgi:AcrR family transcriptional regulator